MKQKLEDERIKYVETNIIGEPLKPYYDSKNTITDITNVKNASLIIPPGVVVVKMNGRNIGNGGNISNFYYSNSIMELYRPFYFISEKRYSEDYYYEEVYLFFKVPDGMTIKSCTDQITLCGYIVDFKISGCLVSVKKNGILNDMKSKLTEERIKNLPELPKELYPLKNESLLIKTYRVFDTNRYNCLIISEHIARIINSEYDFGILPFAIFYLNNFLPKPISIEALIGLVYNYDELNNIKSLVIAGKKAREKVENNHNPWL